MSIVPDTWETEEGRLTGAQEFEASLGNIVRAYLKKKKKSGHSYVTK
jgi:hypothetical protein